MAQDVIERLCAALAVMVVEVEGEMQFVQPEPPADLVENTQAARQLIVEAGHNFDALYPIERRPVFGKGPAPGADPE